MTIYHVVSKVQNIGFDNEDATHTYVYNRYKTIVDKSLKTIFSLN